MSRAEKLKELVLLPHKLLKLMVVDDDYSTDSVEETEDLNKADLITSQIKGENVHTLMIDLDVPAQLVPSTTPGHSHLYIDVIMLWPDYLGLLETLAEVGIIEPGYVKASKRRGYSSLRLPWIKKKATSIE